MLVQTQRRRTIKLACLLLSTYNAIIYILDLHVETWTSAKLLTSPVIILIFKAYLNDLAHAI